MQIEVYNLVKEYKRKSIEKRKTNIFIDKYRKQNIFRAVDNITFSIEKGEMVGYIGPNGSGKSTTIKMLCGILCPTSGRIQINELDPFKNRIENSRNIGVVLGNRSLLWWDVPVIESYRLFQKMYGIPRKQFNENLEKYSTIMGIKDILNVPERQLSLGQKTRCNIVAAFLHNPEIVYLDEPTIGLDIEAKRNIRSCVQKVNKEDKTTFIITSHDLQDIESLCNRIILINQGRIIWDSGLDEMLRQFGKDKIIQFKIRNNKFNNYSLLKLDGIKNVEIVDDMLRVFYNSDKIDNVSIIDLISKACEIYDIDIIDKSIEDIIENIVKSNKSERRPAMKSQV